jgi:hypothetical protein
MYSPETKARIEHIRAILPTIGAEETVDLPDGRKELKSIALMREAVALIREGRVSASITSAAAQRKKAKAVVLDVDSLLGDLEAGPT